MPLPTDRLFQIATRDRPVHREPEIVLPTAPDRAIPPSERFRPNRNSGSRRILELGSGWGEFAADWLERHPADEYVAFEIKGDRIRRTIKHARRLPAAHLRLVPINFSWFLEGILPERSFDLVIINFPDPWPKRRHWKHRLIQPDFPARVAPLLATGGMIHLATDYGPYARRMLRAFRDAPEFESVFAGVDYRRARPDGMPPTRFEAMTSTPEEGEGRTPYYMRWRIQSAENAAQKS